MTDQDITSQSNALANAGETPGRHRLTENPEVEYDGGNEANEEAAANAAEATEVPPTD